MYDNIPERWITKYISYILWNIFNISRWDTIFLVWLPITGGLRVECWDDQHWTDDVLTARSSLSPLLPVLAPAPRTQPTFVRAALLPCQSFNLSTAIKPCLVSYMFRRYQSLAGLDQQLAIYLQPDCLVRLPQWALHQLCCCGWIKTSCKPRMIWSVATLALRSSDKGISDEMSSNETLVGLYEHNIFESGHLSLHTS